MDTADNPRIAQLKQRVEKDPTSIAFAQLAEEYRRSGEFQLAVDVCRDGLSRHPGYVSARVTLARALMELDQYPEAKRELQAVLSVAADNLAAIRAMADVHQKLGDDDEETFSIDAAIRTPDAAPEPEAEPIALDIPLTPPAPDADALPSLDVLDSLSLDLPALPDMNWDLDAALPPEPELAELPELPELPTEPTAPAAPPAPSEPSLRELESWLAAIVADRAQSR